MSKTWLVAVAAMLAACSGNTTTQPDDGGGGSAGRGSGGSAAGDGSNAGGAGSSGGSSAIAGAGGTAKGGVSGSAGAALGGTAGQGASGGAGASGGPLTIPEDAGSGACHDYTPCGGDVVGSWDIEVCADPPLLGLRSFCPAATETLTMTGTADFRADGTMSTTLSVRTETDLPASCVAQLGTCGAPGGLNVLQDCTPDADGSCLCNTMSENGPSDSTYTTTSDGLLTVVSDGEPNYSYYCRQGEELWSRGVDPDDGRITVLHLRKR
jgi:hypothetical protein